MNTVENQEEETVIKFEEKLLLATSDGAEIEVFLSLPIR